MNSPLLAARPPETFRRWPSRTFRRGVGLRRIQRRRPAYQRHLAFVKRHRRFIDIALWIRRKSSPTTCRFPHRLAYRNDRSESARAAI